MATPSTIDGLSLTGPQKRRLELIFKSINATEPSRKPQARLNKAISSWRKTVRPGRRTWVDKPYFRLGRGGEGPVVIIAGNDTNDTA